MINIREIYKTEYPIMQDFLYHAIFIPPGKELPSREIIFEPEIFIYINDFGGKDDCGVIAEQDGVIVGMAWTRIIPAYGNVDDETPELAISILPEYRGRGIGTMLMKRLFELLKAQGYKRTSLSVQKDNPAVRFYERLGYKITGDKLDHANNEDYIMVKTLKTDLTQIPGIGKRMAEHLINAGYPDIESLKGQNPEEIYQKDCLFKGFQEDRCALYCYRLAVAYAEGTITDSEKLKWWNWKD